jgi:Family of unknown function (DUF6755)
VQPVFLQPSRTGLRTVAYAEASGVRPVLADDSVVVPAAAVSAGGLTLNVGLLKYLGRMERTRKGGA